MIPSVSLHIPLQNGDSDNGAEDEREEDGETGEELLLVRIQLQESRALPRRFLRPRGVDVHQRSFLTADAGSSASI